MSKQYSPTPQPWPLNREVLPYVTVELNPPPCERTFRLWYRADGELEHLEIDGAWYRVRLLKSSGRISLDGSSVTLVDVRVNLPDE